MEICYGSVKRRLYYNQPMKRKSYLVIIIILIFIAIPLLTEILGSINPNVSDSFSLMEQ